MRFSLFLIVGLLVSGCDDIGFDEGYRNIVASRKNAKIAGVYDITEFQKYSLVELDVKYSENQFDAVILHITTKDEDKINEIYYQMKYIIHKKL